ncbi:MAG: Xaa-Pro peptidase family protein [Parachlamydiales bacterium]|nr:Xaa-Pro peptidase family protein [Parachlamydiales bacterium]
MDDSRIKKIKTETPLLIEQTADLFYLTGLTLSKGRLLVRHGKTTLFVDGRYFERAKKEAPCPVALWDEFKKVQEKEIGFDSAFVTYDGYLGLKKELPHTNWISKPNPIRELRAIKDEKEISALKKAALLTWKGYKHIIGLLKEGISEEELAFEFEFFCRKNGASGLSFSPIIAFGENGAYPHYRAGKTKLKKDEAVLIDVGAVVDQYCGDMTRVYFFGRPDPKIIHFEELVRSAKEKAMRHIKPGVKIGEIDQIVQDEFDKANVKQLYIHSLGHGIGLEAHEFPRIRYDGADKDVQLMPGMVFTIEPGLYQPGVGGIRLEDMLVVTKNGYENLFPDQI